MIIATLNNSKEPKLKFSFDETLILALFFLNLIITLLLSFTSGKGGAVILLLFVNGIFFVLLKMNFINQKIILIIQLRQLVIFILYYFFVFLSLKQFLFTDYQEPELIDSTYYNFLARFLSENGIFKNFDIAASGWQTQGVVVTYSLLYYFFGALTINSIIFNSTISSLAFIFILKILGEQQFNVKTTNRFFLLLSFLPLIFLYDLLPGKEPLSLFIIASLIYFSIELKKRFSNIKLLVLVFLLLWLYYLRLNLFVIFLLSFLLLFTYINKVLLYVSGLIVTIVLIFIFTNPSSALSTYTNFENINDILAVEQKLSEGGIKKVIIQNLYPTDVFSFIVYIPIRPLIWFFLPYPDLMPSVFLNLGKFINANWNDRFYWYHFIGEFLTKLDSLILILLFPFFFRFICTKNILFKNKNRYIYIFVFSFFLITLLGLSNFAFIEGTRYRTCIEPLFCVFAFIGFNSKNSKLTKQFMYLWYISTFILFSTFLIYKISSV